MASQTLKDRNSKIIGYIDTDSSGKQTIKDPNHSIRGYYDPKTNVTQDRNHSTVGKGNQLSSLL